VSSNTTHCTVHVIHRLVYTYAQRSKAHMCDMEVQTEASVCAQPVLTDDNGDNGLRASLYVDLTQASF
jgi:hypothetical protein